MSCSSTTIDLEGLAQEYRTQKIIFETAREVYDQMQSAWTGSRESLVAQLVRLVERFIRSDRLHIIPALFSQDELARRLIITLNMTKVVQHIWEAIRYENTERVEPVFDPERAHPLDGEYVHLVHRQTLRIHRTQPRQHVCVRQHMGGFGSL